MITATSRTLAIAGSPVPPTLELSSNDYLGLRNDRRLVRASIKALEEHGVGSGGVRSVAVGSAAFAEFEARLAEFKLFDRALMVQSGYMANLAAIPSLVGPGDSVWLDRDNHQSSKDGAVLSGATVKFFDHRDSDGLRKSLRQSIRPRRRRVLVVTDGVFSAGGDVAPLPAIVGAAEACGAMVMVDDAHGAGVLGPGGRGSVHHFGLDGRVDVQVGTASKAFGAVGGYVLGSAAFIARLAKARPILYSTALPPHIAAACTEALRIIQAEPERREALWRNRDRLATGLARQGLDIGLSETPIIPVSAPTPRAALDAAAQLRVLGVKVSALIPPRVGRDGARLRMTVNSSLSDVDIDRAIELIAECARDNGLC